MMETGWTNGRRDADTARQAPPLAVQAVALLAGVVGVGGALAPASAGVYDIWLDRPAFARIAQDLVDRGATQEALTFLDARRPALRGTRERQWYDHVRCYALVEHGAHAQALVACSRRIETGDAFWHDFANRAAAHAWLGHYDDAIADYRQAIRLGGDAARVRRAIRSLRAMQREQRRVVQGAQGGGGGPH